MPGLAEYGFTAATIFLLLAKLAWFHVHLRDKLFDVPAPAGWAGLTPSLFCATLASLLVVFAPLHLLPRSWRYLGLVFLNGSITFLAFADSMHRRFYGDILSATDLSFAGFLGVAWPSIASRTTAFDLLMFADAALCLLAFPLYLRACRGVPRLSRRASRRTAAAMAATGLALLVPPFAPLAGNLNQTYRESPRKDMANAIGLLPYHAFDLGFSLASAGNPVSGPASSTELAWTRRFLEARRARHASASPLFGAARGRNVILINAESLNTFAIGLVIGGQPVTPHLSALIRESLYFPDFYDETYLGTTSDAEFMALNSLYPSRISATAVMFTANHYRALPAVLAERGYATVSAVAADATFWNMWRMDRDYGFTRRYYDGSFNQKEMYGSWISDGSFFSQMTPRLTGQVQPFLAFLLTATSHNPFDLLPKERHILKLGPLEGTLLGNYLQSVHYVDAAVGRFLDQLRAAGLLDRTVFAIYGDHTAFLADQPELLKLLPDRGEDAYRRLLARKRIPLIIRLPEGSHAGEFPTPGGHLDIAPTLLSLLGVNDERSTMLGRDLTSGGSNLVVFRDGSFTDGRRILLNRFGSLSECTCYDMSTGRGTPCAGLESGRKAAATDLRASDLIMAHDLVPALAGSAPHLVRTSSQSGSDTLVR